MAEPSADYEDQYIRVAAAEGTKLRHIIVSGKLVEHSGIMQSMKFAFETDQTVVASLIDQIKQFLAKVS